MPHSLGTNALPRQAQQNVFARLQGLFPTAPPTVSVPDSAQHNIGAPASNLPSSAKPALPIPKFLKVRILTWNMHDSVPKGDLEELLGSVPPESCSCSSGTPGFPVLSTDVAHPYHIVVIAGQECPSLSGIPMGLGAGFKLIDKDRDREREKDKDKSRERDRDYDKLRSKHNEKEKLDSEDPSQEPPGAPPVGWTSIIEDWLCHGSRTPEIANGCAPDPKRPHTSECPRPVTAKEQPKGPYQLLIKERMMGIYLAVYINRDIRRLVKGTSRSAVTAGLIGGRLGNKGGVGISLNLDGTTLLFLNAHLAAHEGKVNHRLANFAKIKAELSVDDFLTSDDPRVMSEDLTDKFDYTFLCGDLNFRLDISRLHADWLISRQDYAQALAFDQLRNLMHNGQAFVGFKEAEIDFPPTFKYDVLRTFKRAKRRHTKINHWKLTPERANRLTEVEERESEDLEDDDAEDEAASLTSSVWTSVHSKPSTDVDDDDYFSHPLSTPGSRVSITATAQKAKTRFLALLSPGSAPNSPTKRPPRPRSALLEPWSHEGSSVDVTVTDSKPDNLSLPASPHPGSKISGRWPGTSTKSTNHSDEEDEDGDRGVYDSSHKKRVPSWCDRILWKSTVEPGPEPEEDDHYETHSRPRTRVGQFLANAFRPLSTRVRRDSHSSMSSAELPNVGPTSPSSSSESDDLLDRVLPFSRTQNKARLLHHSKSSDHMSSRGKSQLLRHNPHDVNSPSPRKRPTTSSYSPMRPDSPPRIDTHIPSSLLAADGFHQPDSPHGMLKELPMLPAPSRWRFFPFRSRDSTPPTNTPDPSSIVDILPPRKGEVVCLSYTTLDDRGMRRLEGRSDHRPVIGSYAVYI